MLPKLYPINGTEGYPRTTPMRVIVCGFPRTGTLSTHAALQMLGFNRTHHMIHVITDTDGQEFTEWTRAFRAKYRGDGTFTKLDWDRLLGDCQGAIDYPSVLFAADLAQVYPDAKVVMLNRDPDKWYESVSETVGALRRPGLWHAIKSMYCFMFSARMRDSARFWKEMSFAEGVDTPFEDKEKAIAFMKRNYDECRNVVEEERRIEWTVQEGWEPLCRHLGVDVPMVEDAETGKMVVAPFPRVNDRESFKKSTSKSLDWAVHEANAVVFGLLGRGVVVGAVGYGLFVAWKLYPGRG